MSSMKKYLLAKVLAIQEKKPDIIYLTRTQQEISIGDSSAKIADLNGPRKNPTRMHINLSLSTQCVVVV